MEKSNNIQHIADNMLCTACGGCEAVCPVNSISINTNIAGYLIADVDAEKCISCGNCLIVCPSVKDNIAFDANTDMFHGEVICTYVGYATDEKIRRSSQSGGVVTALLTYLVEKKKIDGVIVNRFDTVSRRPKVFYEEDVSKIIASSGSCYSQSSVVSEILRHQDKKTAAVLLGCQNESMNHIRNSFPNYVLPKYFIGLICAGQHSGNYIDDLASRAGGFSQGISNFRFRDKSAGGWPGDTLIKSVNGKSKILDRSIRQSLKPAFEVHRCMYCFDQMNSYSDITVGDPWGLHEKMDKKGNTVILVRTQNGKELIESAMEDGVIIADRISTDRVFQGQTVDGRLKTQFFTSMKMAERSGYEMPYDSASFKHIEYKEPTSKEESVLKNRFEYSRKIYGLEDLSEYRQILKQSIRKINTKRNLMKLKALPRRVMSKIYRAIKR